jgi:hypothetical protein
MLGNHRLTASLNRRSVRVPQAISREHRLSCQWAFSSTNWISSISVSFQLVTSLWNAGRFLRSSFLPAFPALASQFSLLCRMGLMPDPVMNPVQTSRMSKSQAIALILRMEQWFSRCAKDPHRGFLYWWNIYLGNGEQVSNLPSIACHYWDLASLNQNSNSLTLNLTFT